MTSTAIPPVSAAATNKLSVVFGASYASVLVGTIEGSAGNYGNGSATVANMLNTFAANPNNQLVMGKAGAGISTTQNATDGSATITWDPSLVVPDPSAVGNSSTAMAFFADLLAHELGHATQVGGFSAASTNPAQAAQNGDNAEGVANVAEYNAANEMGLPIMASGIGIQTAIQGAGNNYGAEVAAAAAYTGPNLNPSVAPNLSYDQYYADSWALNAGSGNSSLVVWSQVTPQDVSTTTNTNGSWTISSRLPVNDPDSPQCTVIVVNGSGPGTTSSGGTSAPVASNSVQGLTSSGSTAFTQNTNTSAAGATTVSITGNGDSDAVNNATITLTGNGTSARVVGSGDSTTLQDQGEQVTQSGGSITLGSNGTNESIFGTNVTINGQTSRTFGVDGTGLTVDANNAALTMFGNNDSASIMGAGNQTTLQDQGEQVTQSGGSIPLGSNGTNESIFGTNVTINGETSRKFGVDGTGLTVDANNAVLTMFGNNDSASIVGAGDQTTLQDQGERVTQDGGSITLGSNGTNEAISAADTTINGENSRTFSLQGEDMTVNATNAALTVTGGSDFALDGGGSHINVTSGTGTGMDLDGAGDVVTGSNCRIDLAPNETVTITGTHDIVVGSTNDVINMSATYSYVDADSSTIDFSGSNTGDVVQGDDDHGTDWGRYIQNGAPDGGGDYGYYGDGDDGDLLARRASAKGSVASAHEDISAIAAARGGQVSSGSSVLEAASCDQQTVAASRKGIAGSWTGEAAADSVGLGAVVSSLSSGTAFSPASSSDAAPAPSVGIGTRVQQLVQAMANFSVAPSVGTAGDAEEGLDAEMARLATPRMLNRNQGLMRV